MKIKEFIKSFPDDIYSPDVSADLDGDICFDWMEDKHKYLTLSLSEDNKITYAWICGDEKGHGTEYFDGKEIPKIILDSIRKIES